MGRAPEVSVVYTLRAWESKEEEGFQAKESRDWLCSGRMGGGSGKQDEEEVARIMGRQQQLRSRKEVEAYEKLGGRTTRTWGSDGTWRGEVEERGRIWLPIFRLAGGVPHQLREPKRSVWGLGDQLGRRRSGGRDEGPRAPGLPVPLLRFLRQNLIHSPARLRSFKGIWGHISKLSEGTGLGKEKNHLRVDPRESLTSPIKGRGHTSLRQVRRGHRFLRLGGRRLLRFLRLRWE